MPEPPAEPAFTALPLCRQFRHSFLIAAVRVVLPAAFALALCRALPAETAVPDTVTLAVGAEGGIAEERLSPPPGSYLFPQGDTVILRACGAPGDAAPLWTGDVADAASVTSASLDGDRHAKAVMPLSGKAVPPGSGVFPASANRRLHAFLGSGGLYGWLTADRTRPDRGAGISHLVSADYPCAPVFLQPSLNFEHILNGCAADAPRSRNTPRTDPMLVRCLSPSRVEVTWPANGASWNMDCTMRYAFAGTDAVDLEFEVTPRADEAPNGYLVFMFASYMVAARERAIRFPGERDGAAGWVTFGGSMEQSGTISGKGQEELARDAEVPAINLEAVDGVRFTEPVYYGLVDGDRNPETTDDTMALIMMFDDPKSVRFAVWNWSDQAGCSAWDWQFIVRQPQVGRTCRQKARAVYCRFDGGENVLKRYRAWRSGAETDADSASASRASFPILLAPGDNGFDPLHMAGRVAEADPALALREYTRLARIPLYGELAREKEDRLFESTGDLPGRALFWDCETAEQPSDSAAWYHLAAARAALGDLDEASTACEEALRVCPEEQRARVMLGGLTAWSGSVDAGLQMMEEAVGSSPALDHAAAEACATVAEHRRAIGDAPGAAALVGHASKLVPGNLPYRVLLGGVLEAMGDDNGALEQYRTVLEKDPELPFPGERMDAILLRRGDSGARAAEWKRLAEAGPRASVPRMHLGMALEDAGDAAGAEAAYRESMALWPQWLEPKARLGTLIAAQGRVAEGLQFVDEAVGMLPDLAGTAADGCACAAKARLAAGDGANALTLLRRARALVPTDLRHRVQLGDTLEALGDNEGALSEFRAVVDEAPESPHSGARIDAIYAQRKDTIGWVAEWRRVAAAHPGAALPQLHLGLALEAAGDGTGAEAAYREALSRNASVGAASTLFRRVRNGGGPAS